MRHPIQFTYLGFYLNSLVDSGKKLDLTETHNQIRNRTIFKWLDEKFSDEIDLSLYSKEDLSKLIDFFESLSIATDEKRKMGIEKNGLCLLVAYCFAGVQRTENNIG